MDIGKAFTTLFKKLRDDDLFQDGPKIDIDLKDARSIRAMITQAAANLPGTYLEAYVAPLLRNLESVLRREPEYVETLSGAIYDHGHPTTREIIIPLTGFLGVVSNIYRSFLEPEPSTTSRMPSPETLIPPLATFRPHLDIEYRDYGPFTLTADMVNLLCGGKIGVVSLPSNYRNHPILCWGAVAHETGGHDVLRAYGLVKDMRRGVRKLFYLGPDPATDIPESREQFLGLLWEFWTEEAASDVCALLNLGPSYGLTLPVYIAALNERIRRHRNRSKKRERDPHLTVSWPPLKSGIKYVDPHPTDILKLNVLIGAIEALVGLNSRTQKHYISQIQRIIAISLESDKKRGMSTEHVQIIGHIRFKPGRWVTVNRDKKFIIERAMMEDYARRVGRFIATEPFPCLNGNCIQNLETWDDSDELVAQKIRKRLSQGKSWARVGDDAQLLAGSLLFLLDRPDRYESLNKSLGRALSESYAGDPIWGHTGWHPLATGPVRYYPRTRRR